MRIVIDIEDDAIEEGTGVCVAYILGAISGQFMMGSRDEIIYNGSDKAVGHWKVEGGHKVVMDQNPAKKS